MDFLSFPSDLTPAHVLHARAKSHAKRKNEG